MPREKQNNPTKRNIDEATFSVDPLSAISNELTSLNGTVSRKRRLSKKSKNSISSELQDLLAPCTFYIEVLNVSEESYKLGEFTLEMHLESFLPDIPECLYFYASEDPAKCLLYWDFPSKKHEPIIWKVLCSVDYEILSTLRLKKYIKVSTGFQLSTDRPFKTVILTVSLNESAFIEPLYPSQVYDWPKTFGVVKCCQHFLGVCISVPGKLPTESHEMHDTNWLYSKIRAQQKEGGDIGSSCVQHVNLKPKLRPYQAEAVQWMVHRETQHKATSTDIHPLYKELVTKDMRRIYIQKFTGNVTLKRPIKLGSSPGGILADEMGLGKTIEVLALILNHPKSEGALQSIENFETENIESNSDQSNTPSVKTGLVCFCDQEKDSLNEDIVQCTRCSTWQHSNCVNFDMDMEEEANYLCPSCWTNPSTKTLLHAKTTLVVTPASICYQWQEEIEKHVENGTLKFMVYCGVQKVGFVQPTTLAQADVVLTTYEIFKTELNYVDLPNIHGNDYRHLRRPKRFNAAPSPLIALNWWRICLDEAQMVEAVSSKMAEMALRLNAVHHWCITGTPIQKSMQDLYGLLLFLGEDPFWVKSWWKELLYDSYCLGNATPLVNTMASCFRRTSKADVADQIGIPPQIEQIHWLKFSPVEEHFYKRQQEECSKLLVQRTQKFADTNQKLKSLDKHTLNLVLNPLIRLRQACCHPQIIRGHLLPFKRNTMTMEDLLSSLIKRTKLECEEAHRQVISAMNGIAGLFIIQERYEEAIKMYREVLQAVQEHESVIKTDKLQKLHTLYNLSSILEQHSENFPEIGHTLREDNLKEEATQLESQYLMKCKEAVTNSLNQMTKASSLFEELESQIPNGMMCPWWIDVLELVVQKSLDEACIGKVKDMLTDMHVTGMESINDNFHSVGGLKLIVLRYLNALIKYHETLKNSVMGLSPVPQADQVNDAIECHLRPTGKTVFKCLYCKIDEQFNKFESQLFCFKEQASNSEPNTSEEALMGKMRRGTWADSKLEVILKAILDFARNAHINEEVERAGVTNIKLFDALKKEFRNMRSVWMSIRDFASAIDELEMAKIRMRLRYPGEPKADPPVNYILDESDVHTMDMQLSSDRTSSKSVMVRKLGQLFYLQNLEKVSLEESGRNPDPCPICHKELGVQWSVLQCGHCYCIQCVRIMIVDYSAGSIAERSIKCAICRQPTTLRDIYYVDMNRDVESDETAVKGSHSTKVEEVVRCILKLRKAEPNVKALVFSSWPSVLSILAFAMEENGIPFASLVDHSKFVNNLTNFKYDKEIPVLLLPISSGSKGLNIIEATHVLLVEPLLNPASELQALGRVHRIGQTKETTFHRFIVRGTIEERIHYLQQPNSDSFWNREQDENSMTFKDLCSLVQDYRQANSTVIEEGIS